MPSSCQRLPLAHTAALAGHSSSRTLPCASLGWRDCKLHPLRRALVRGSVCSLENPDGLHEYHPSQTKMLTP